LPHEQTVGFEIDRDHPFLTIDKTFLGNSGEIHVLCAFELQRNLDGLYEIVIDEAENHQRVLIQ